MRNRAKCKVCETIIESTGERDLSTCKCGEISIVGKNPEEGRYRAYNWENFIFLDDENHEIVAKVSDEITIDKKDIISHKPTKEEIIEELSTLVNQLIELPTNQLYMPVNSYDMYRFMALVVAILKS